MRLPDRSVVQLDIGGVKLTVTSLSGGNNDRRIARYRALGVNGAELEDLGQDERQDSYAAVVSEVTFLELEAIKEAGQAVQIVHPLFGTYLGRLVSLRYQASSRSGIGITLAVVEDGVARAKGITAPSLPSAAGACSAAWADVNASILDLAVLPGLPAEIYAGIATITTQWAQWSGLQTMALAGLVSGQSLAASMQDLGTAADTLLAATDNQWGLLAGIEAICLEDSLFPLMTAVRAAVNAASATTARGFVTHTTASACSLAWLALQYMGREDDDTLDLILAQNPNQVDVAWVRAGVTITIPLPA
jgi:hypothetical protein